MKIKKIKIEKFRHMKKDVEIEFGDRLTVISGTEWYWEINNTWDGWPSV